MYIDKILTMKWQLKNGCLDRCFGFFSPRIFDKILTQNFYLELYTEELNFMREQENLLYNIMRLMRSNLSIALNIAKYVGFP
jgi:hypothetical protein